MRQFLALTTRSPLLLTLILGCVLSACSADRVSNPEVNFAEASDTSNHSVDIVKLIAASIADKNNDKTYLQTTYEVSAESRLLLRNKALPGLTSRIRADQPIQLRIYLAEGQSAEAAVNSLRVCPLRSQWNMSATWNSGGLREDWAPGGDIDLAGCVRPISASVAAPAHAALVAKPTREAVGICAESDSLCFDVTAWYRDYVLARGSFAGLALISADGATVKISGENAGAKAPSLEWSEAALSQ